MIRPSDPTPVPQGRPSFATASCHVGLDTMMGCRSRDRPEEVTINGFLLLDTGEYELVTAHLPLDVFWKMKALDVVGHVRTANRARAARPVPHPQVGSVWLVDGELELPTTGPLDGDQDTLARHTCGGVELVPIVEKVASCEPADEEAGVDDPDKRTFRLRVHAVHSLDRVAIEPKGPRFIETLHVRDMLPEFRAD